MPEPQISVLMPTYNQAAFIRRAVYSLLAQTYTNWELLIMDDGSTDDTPALIAELCRDSRVRDWRFDENRGLGSALNWGLAVAQAPLVTYLPSDDLYFPDHLESLEDCLRAHPDASLSYSGLRFHQRQTELGKIPSYPLQLVQVMHRCNAARWIEREELVSDDLERLFWKFLSPHGPFIGTGTVSCEWVDHPRQHHKCIRENMGGGLNPYRSRYAVKHPLRFHSSVGSYTDEVTQYRRFRERRDTPASPDGLKILLVGELAFNPDRILALEERGHRLYGLWTDQPWWLNTVGPLPFGHVQDIPRADWRGVIRKLQPDIIYALLNWQAVPFVHEVLQANLGIPFVWHFKEGPWLCLEHGTWPQMIDLQTKQTARSTPAPKCALGLRQFCQDARIMGAQ